MENRMLVLQNRINRLEAIRCNRKQLDRMYLLKGQCEKEFYSLFRQMTQSNQSLNFLAGA